MVVLLAKEEINEETYSLIFNSLKHPIRRNILRMLVDGPLTFSEILDGLSIDSAHMTYHLEQLGELIARTSDGKYKLSSIGIAAKNLMRRVEEQTPPSVLLPKNKIILKTILKMLTLQAVVLLVFASFYVSLNWYRSNKIFPRQVASSSVLIPSNQSFSYNVTIVYLESGPSEHKNDSKSITTSLPKPLETPTKWERDSFDLLIDIFSSSFIHIEIYDPNEILIENRTDTLPHSPTLSPFWTLKTFEIGETGTYRIEVNIVSEQPYCGTLKAWVIREYSENPYYYYGVAGLVSSTVFPTVTLLLWVVKKKKLKL
jgi:DNA-binding transcriptional ArsR family regulator